MQTKVERILADNDYLKTKNSNWPSYHQTLANFFLPRAAFINTIRTVGQPLQNQWLFDSCGVRSAKICSSGIHTNLTNPATKWFGIQNKDIRYMEIKEVKIWYRMLEEAVRQIINGSNFDTVLGESYVYDTVFGTSVMYADKDFKRRVKYRIIPLDQPQMAEGADGNVNTVYRTFKLTAIQAYEIWGENAGKSVIEAIRDKKPYKELDFIHYCAPRHVRQAGKIDSVNMPFASVWINKIDSKIIEESGFKTFPYIVGRFYQQEGEVFGFSPGMDVLMDTAGINTMRKTIQRRAMKEADPPFEAPFRGYLSPWNFNPGAGNLRDPKIPRDQGIQFLMPQGNFSITTDTVMNVEQAIEKGFFVNTFQALTNLTKRMTIPEVHQRIAEAMALLGPVIGRQTSGKLTHAIERTIDLTLEDLVMEGELPPPPDILKGQEWDITFCSTLTMAQRSGEINSLQSFLALVGQLAAVKPESLDKVDIDLVIDEASGIYNVNPKLIRDLKQTAMIRDARARAQAAQAQLLALEQAGKASKDMAQAGLHSANAQAVGKK